MVSDGTAAQGEGVFEERAEVAESAVDESVEWRH